MLSYLEAALGESLCSKYLSHQNYVDKYERATYLI